MPKSYTSSRFGCRSDLSVLNSWASSSCGGLYPGRGSGGIRSDSPGIPASNDGIQRIMNRVAVGGFSRESGCIMKAVMRKFAFVFLVAVFFVCGILTFTGVIFQPPQDDPITPAVIEPEEKVQEESGGFGGGFEGAPAEPETGSGDSNPPSPAAEPGEQRRIVKGDVADESGRPLAGIRLVLALPWGKGRKFSSASQALEILRQFDMQSWPSALSAEDGSFSIETGKAGICFLITDSPQYRQACVEVDVPSRSDPPPVHLVLGVEPRRLVKGSVTDETGLPLHGVRLVLALPWGRGQGFAGPGEALRMFRETSMSSWPSASSMADGSFQIEATKTGRCFLIADSPSHRQECVQVDVPSGADPEAILLILAKGLSIEGKVVDGLSGKGMEGICVVMRQASRPGFGSDDAMEKQVPAGAEGAFVAGGFRAGQVLLSPKLQGMPEYTTIRQELAVNAGDLGVRIVIWPLGSVEFMAIPEDGEDPAPVVVQAWVTDVPGAQRYPFLPYNAFMPFVRQNSPSIFVLRSIAGTHEYVLEAPGFVPARVEFNVEAGKKTTRTEPVVFSRGASIGGRIKLEAVDEGGVIPPWRGGTCHFERIDRPEGFIRSVPLGDCSRIPESYSITGLEPGKYLFTILSAGRQPLQAELSVEDGPNTWDIYLRNRTAASEPIKPRFKYQDRKNVLMTFAVSDVTLDASIEWLSALSGVGLRMGVDVEEDLLIQLNVQGIVFGDLLKLMLNMRNLVLDEATGEILPRKD